MEPTILPVLPDGVPTEMKSLPGWLLWKLEFRNGKWTKPPYTCRGGHAKSTDPKTWTTFEKALRAYNRPAKTWQGIGLSLDVVKRLCGIDLDHCIDPKTGEIATWALKIVRRLKSYTERSPSGTGLRILFFADLPVGGRKKKSIEVYESGRYLTITGHRLDGTPETVEDRTEEVRKWHREVFGAQKGTAKDASEMADEELLEKARKAANGYKFSKLYDRGEIGDYRKEDGSPDASAADQALCNLLAFFTGPDAGRIDMLFRRSALYRPKWDEVHYGDGRTYGAATIDQALSGRTEFYNPSRPFTRDTQAGPAVEEEDPTGGLYEMTPTGFVWFQHIKDDVIRRRLTNFTALITGDILHDDGAERFRRYEMDAALNGFGASFVIPCDQFPKMNWPEEHLGAKAVVFAGHGLKDHTRCAIQLLSRDIRKRQTFGHTGWRQWEGEWIFLHAAGAIGANGTVLGMEVILPPGLSRFVLPDPPAGEALKTAVRASLEMLKAGSREITVPLLAAIYRAVIGGSDFSEHLAGPTGVGKSELCAITQQHFGAGMDRQHLPASWSSTGNALEALAFGAKDCILVIDDFAPTGNASDIQRFHRDADRVLRAQGNDAGRQRMKADSTLRPGKPPRGVILSSGEDIPRGQSLRARLLAMEVAESDVSWSDLGICQKCGREGLYALAVAAFVQWLAPRYTSVLAGLRMRVADLRAHAYTEGQHKRTPGIVADLSVGLDEFLSFAQEIGVLTEPERLAAWESGWSALGHSAAAQAKHHAAAEPTARFLELLSAAIASGEAHVADREGGAPLEPLAWGWRRVEVGSGEFSRFDWRPQGKRVGWLNCEYLYLEPDASFVAAQEVGRRSGDALAVTPQTLRKRLNEQGVLAEVDGIRGTLTVRKVVEKARQTVLSIRPGILREKPAHSETAHENDQD